MLLEVAEEIEGELDRKDEKADQSSRYQSSRRLASESSCGGRR